MSALGRNQTFMQDQLFSASNVRFWPKADVTLSACEIRRGELAAGRRIHLSSTVFHACVTSQ